MPQSAAKPPTHPSTASSNHAASPPRANRYLSSDKAALVDCHPTAVVYGAIATPASTTPTHAPMLEKQAGGTTAPSSRNRHNHAVAASTSFFGIPRSFSTFTTRSSQSAGVAPGEIDYVSLYVVYFITLVSEASRGLVLPSTWPFFRSLGGTKDMLGVFVASLSFGRMVSTIPLGWLSDRYSSSTVLLIASLVQAAGHFAYSLSGNLTWLYVSRVVVGVGSATMSVCRAHLTRAIPSSARTHHFAYLSALQFIGFAVLPGFGGLLALLPHVSPLPALTLNGFTYPAFVLVFANLLCVALIHYLYVDPPAPSGAGAPGATSASGVGARATGGPASTAATHAVLESAQPDALALVICMVVNVVFRGVIAELETVFVPFLMEEYTLSYGLSSMYLSAVGFIGLFVYVSFKPIARRFSDRALVSFGLAVIAGGCVPLAVRTAVGAMPSWAYVALVGLTWSIGYPVGQTAILSLFSKVLGGLPAGSFLGMFSAAGSMARLGMAILAGRLWNGFGRDSVYAVMVSYVLVTGVVVALEYRRLVPAAL